MTDVTSGAAFEPGMDPDRRNWIVIACGAGAVGGVAVAVPFSRIEHQTHGRLAEGLQMPV
jgi:hypothetical protein